MTHILKAAAAGAALLSPATVALADPEAVWHRHVDAAITKDVDTVLTDFSDGSTIITVDGVLEGKAAIRGFFEAFFAGLEPGELEGIVSHAQIVHGDVVVANFTIGDRTFHDTALIHDDRIQVLSTVSYPAK